MEKKQIDHQQILNLYLGINEEKNHLIEADYSVVSQPYFSTDPLETSNIDEKAKIDFQHFRESFVQNIRHHHSLEKLVFKRYQLKNTEMKILPGWDLEKLDQNYIFSFIFPFIVTNDIVPAEVVPFIKKTESLQINQEQLNNCNAEQLIRKYSNIPEVIRNIVEVLSKDPLQICENKGHVLDALNDTIYIKSLQYSSSKNLTNLHLLIGHLKSIDASAYNQLKDLINFQDAKYQSERIRLIFAYEHQIEVTKKQVEIYTLKNDKITSQKEIFQAFQYTDYFKQNYFQSIRHQGPQPYHLIRTGQKLFYANNMINHIKDGFPVNLDTYWILQEDALKEKISIKIELIKHYPLDKDMLQHVLLEVKNDINVCIRKKFHGIESLIEDIEMLNSKYPDNNLPNVETEKITGPQNLDFDLENLSKLQFERSHLHRFAGDLSKDIVSDTILISGWENSTCWSEINASIDKSISYCPILEPIFHCTINFPDNKKYIANTLLKDFVKDYLTALGYTDNPFIVSMDPIYDDLDIYTLNFIQINNRYHPICTVNHYANSKKILLELEKKYNLIKCPQKNFIKEFLHTNEQDNKNIPPQNKGVKL